MFNYLIVFQYYYVHHITIGNHIYQLDHEFRSNDLLNLYKTLDEKSKHACVILNIIYLGKS